jgi:hypothetical protein
LAFSFRARGELILHTDPNQYGEYLVGTTGQVVSRFADDAVNYADVVRQNDTTNGRVLKLQYGTVGSPTTVLDVTKTTIAAANFAQKGRRIFDVRAYGALGDGSDQTTAILAARADILSYFGSTGYGAILLFGPGVYRMNQPLVFQSMYGLTIRGSGPNNSVLSTVSRGDKWAGLHQLDLANSSNCSIEKFDVRNDQYFAGSGANMPDTGIFWAQGTGNGSNANRIDDVRIEGAYRRACFYDYAVPSSSVNELDCYLRSNAAVSANNDVNTACVILTRDNTLGLVASNGLALATAGGAGSMSDVAFLQCELHDEVALDLGIATSDTSGLWLDEAYEISYRDGNISSGGGTYVRQTSATLALGGIGCRNNLFSKMTAYPEGSTTTVALAPPDFVRFDMAAGHAAVSSNLVIDDGCYIALRGTPSAGASTAAVIHGGPGAEFRAPRLRNWFENTSAYVGYALRIDSPGGTLSGAFDLDCKGFPVIVSQGSGTGITGDGHFLRATSAVTADFEVFGEFQLTLGGLVTLAGGGTVYVGVGGSATETIVRVPVAHAMRVRNMRVYTASNINTGESITCTLRKNGANAATQDASIMTAVVSGLGTGPGVNSNKVANFAASDWLDVMIVASNNGGFVNPQGVTVALDCWRA